MQFSSCWPAELALPRPVLPTSVQVWWIVDRHSPPDIIQSSDLIMQEAHGKSNRGSSLWAAQPRCFRYAAGTWQPHADGAIAQQYRCCGRLSDCRLAHRCRIRHQSGACPRAASGRLDSGSLHYRGRLGEGEISPSRPQSGLAYATKS